MPWKPASLEREKHTLQMKLLQTTAQLRLKTIYCERLEYLLRERLARIDELNGKLEQVRAANHRLEQECKHLAGLIAANTTQALLSNVER